MKDFLRTPLAHQALLESLGWRKKIDLVDDRIEANAKFLKEIVDYPEIFEAHGFDQEDEHDLDLEALSSDPHAETAGEDSTTV